MVGEHGRSSIVQRDREKECPTRQKIATVPNHAGSLSRIALRFIRATAKSRIVDRSPDGARRIRDQSPRWPCALLRADLALLHETALGGPRKRLAIRADGLCRTGVFLALLHE